MEESPYGTRDDEHAERESLVDDELERRAIEQANRAVFGGGFEAPFVDPDADDD